MATPFAHSIITGIVGWLYTFILILTLIVMEGKDAISWVLITLYELFFQRNADSN